MPIFFIFVRRRLINLHAYPSPKVDLIFRSQKISFPIWLSIIILFPTTLLFQLLVSHCVFARRGYNIDSLCVGLNEDKAIFTIMVVSDDNSIAKLIKQLNKLAKVRKVENVTDK